MTEPPAWRRLNDLADLCDQASANYAAHYGIERSDDWLYLKLMEEAGEVAAAHLAATSRARKEGDRAALGRELADLIGQALTIARRHDIDIDDAIAKKWLSRL